jgi:hypothetical protein
MDRRSLKKVMFKLFVLLVYFLPILLLINVGIKGANAGLYLSLIQKPLAFGAELNAQITSLGGSFWQLILAYVIISVFTASKFGSRLYDRLALRSGSSTFEVQMIPPVNPVEVGFADNGSNLILQTHLSGGKAVKPGQKVAVSQSADALGNPTIEVNAAILEENLENAAQKVHQYLV